MNNLTTPEYFSLGPDKARKEAAGFIEMADNNYTLHTCTLVLKVGSTCYGANNHL